MIIDEEDHTPGTSVVATNLRANMSESAAFGGAACDWVKAHREDWIKWVDRVCTPGFEFRRFSGRCEMCVPGTYSPDGEPCDECVDGREAVAFTPLARPCRRCRYTSRLSGCLGQLPGHLVQLRGSLVQLASQPASQPASQLGGGLGPVQLRGALVQLGEGCDLFHETSLKADREVWGRGGP